MSNTDRVVNYIIENAGKLTSDKIKALSGVVAALSGENETTKEANSLPVAQNEEELMTPSPIDFNEVQGFQVDNGKINKVKIYGSKT